MSIVQHLPKVGSLDASTLPSMYAEEGSECSERQIELIVIDTSRAMKIFIAMSIMPETREYSVANCCRNIHT